LEIGRRRYSIDHPSNDMTLLDFAPSLAWPVEHLHDTSHDRIDWPTRRMRRLPPRHHLTMASDHLVVGFAVGVWHGTRPPSALE